MRAEVGESRAELEAKLTALQSENAALRAREGASRTRGTANSRVLQAIAAGPKETARALGMIAESACALCSAHDAVILLKRDDVLVLGAHSGPIPTDFAEFPITSGRTAGRSVLEKRPVHVHDLTAAADEFPEGAEMARRLGHRTTLSVPMLSGGEAIGSITLRRFELKPFSEDEAALLAVFADQAAIAVENTRLISELEKRNSEISAALERQTATSEVLAAISRSSTELQSILDVIVSTAARLCDADMAGVLREGEDGYRYVSLWALSPDDYKYMKELALVAGRGSLVGRVLLEGRTDPIEDALSDPEYAMRDVQDRIGFRSMLGVPLLREGQIVGVLVLFRRIVHAFSVQETLLIETFADQAAIAIENARLFAALRARTEEVQEALDQQTATSEILRAISTSMTDAQPVFDTIVRNAVSLCGSLFANVFRFDGELLHFVASHNVGPGYVEVLREKYPICPEPSQVSGRVIISNKVVRLEDALADPDYDQKFLSAWPWRRMLGVPMVRNGIPLGVIVVGWAEAGPVPERQEELLKTFADQAVIAIENARLFETVQARTRELEEALAYQTATAQILQVIGRSPSDAQPVFDGIVEAGRKLFPDAAVSIALPEGDSIVAAAVADSDPNRVAAWRSVFPFPLTRDYMHSRAILDCAVIDIPDAARAPEDLEVGARNFLRSGYRAVTIVPMVRGNRAIGAISVVRAAPGALNSKERDLMSTFASQAVIAIENARLFEALASAVAEFNVVLDNID